MQIRTKRQTQELFRPNWAQREVVETIERQYRAKEPCRIIVLKARQLGISTLAEGVLFLWALLHHNTNSCVVAHERDSSEDLFDKTKLYYETFPFKSTFPTRYSSRKQMTFEGTGSNIWVLTADNIASGRGRTIHCLHASEVGFWKEPTEAMLALQQTMPNLPGTVQIIESTANGIGNWFESAWSKAKAGDNDYIPLFFPWWREPNYIPCEGSFCLDGSCPRCREATGALGRLDDDEKDLVRLGCDRTHLAWRRGAIDNKCFGSIDLFHQEYPATDTEAFLAEGVNAFPEPMLRACYEPLAGARFRLVKDETVIGGVRAIPDGRGPLRIFRMPSSDQNWGQYFVGADPCHGIMDGDNAAAHVINRHNKEQVAVWHGKINPIDFADELAKLGAFYNYAMIAPEVDGPGYATVGRLVSIYPKIWQHRNVDRTVDRQISTSVLGWSTNWKRKQWAINKLAETFEKGQIVLHDETTFQELRVYTFYGANGYGDVYGPAKGGDFSHDDLVMSLAITMLCESTEPKPSPYEMTAPTGKLIFGERVDTGDEW